jgi:hypothetical protein
VVGVIGVALAVAALVSRRDGGTGVARPVVGLLFSLLHTAFAAGLLFAGNALQPPPPPAPGTDGTQGTEWVYRPPHSAYRLTLPSAEWKEVPPIGGVGEASFVRAYPRVFSTVWSPMPEKSGADFDGMIEEFRAVTKRNTLLVREPKQREGTNPAGYRYYYCSTLEAGPQGQPVFTAFSMTWIAEERMVAKVAFEGVTVMGSQAGREAELTAMEQTAERILLSVE